jgi:alpha-1,3/alpha-1,6-mannosyltransferase
VPNNTRHSVIQQLPGQADIILANSYFTSRVYLEAFPSLYRPPHVVYPCIDVDAYVNNDAAASGSDVDLIRS